MADQFPRNLQYAKFSAYGFLKNLRFFDPFMVLFLLEQGLGFLEVGSLYAFREIAVNVLEIPTGAVADALGRRRTMIASFASYLVSFAGFWFGTTIGHFVIAMLLFSFGEAFRTGTHKAMIFTYLRINGLERFSNDYYGHTRAWSQAGSALSAIIAAGIVFLSGSYRAVFLYSTIPYVLDLLLMVSYPSELDGTRGSLTWRDIGASFRSLAHGLRATARRPGATRSVASTALFSGLFRGTKDYLQPVVAALALSVPIATTLSAERREAVVIGAVYTLLYVMTSFSSRASARVATKLHSPSLALNWELVIGLILAFLTGLFRWQSWTLVAVVLFASLYALENLRKPVGIACVSERVSDDVLATVLSVESQLQSLVAAGVALLVGALAELAGGNVGPGIAGAAAAGALALPFVWVRAQDRDSSARTIR
ncbi:MAG: MFS transporter [Spirochaetota bacterium]